MLYIAKLCNDNNISKTAIALILDIRPKQASRKIDNTCQFTIKELYLLKDWFVKQKILTEDFDIGTFLNDA